MIALLAAMLLFTAPATDSAGAAITTTLECVAYRQRQSPTYLAHRDSLIDNRTPYFSLHWAQVRAESDTDSFAHVYAQPGAVCSVALPDSGWWRFVICRKTPGGRWSPRSNFTFR